MSASASQCLLYRHQRFSAIWSNLSEDIRHYLHRSPAHLAVRDDSLHRLSAFLSPGVLCLLGYRFAHCLFVNGWQRPAVWVSRLNSLVHKVTIAPQSCLGPGCLLPHPAGVTFLGRAGRDVSLYSLAVCCPREDSMDDSVESGPVLGDRVTVGAHAVLLGPITVGDDARIAFSVRLDRDTPAGVLVISKALRQTRRPIPASEGTRSV